MKSNLPIRRGVSLVEAVIALAILMLLIGSIYGLMLSALRIVKDDQGRTAAIAIARKHLELIKNLAYDDVGTVGGVPSGAIPQSQTEVINNQTYTIAINIKYVDDAFDQQAPLDTLNTDYKKVRVRVTWDDKSVNNPVTLVSNIVPTTIESTATGGTLWLEVFDPSETPAVPIKNATVTIVAPGLNPPVNTTGETDADGRLILPGIAPGIEAYNITVTKQNYSSDGTYNRDAITNPNPNPPNLNVLAGEITQEYFEISRQANLLAIHLQDYQSGNHISIPFRLYGTKTIGTTGTGLPIYKFDQTITPNPGANAELHDIEADSYQLQIDALSVGYVIAGYDQPLPFNVLSQTSQTITVLLAPYVPYSALINVRTATNAAIANASVRLQSGAYDTTVTTNSSGQSFFNTLSSGTYTITITASGYTTYTGSVIINGNEDQTLVLSQ